MSNNLSQKILLVGAGYMAVEYARVLAAMNLPFIVVGRSKKSAKEFEKVIHKNVETGGLDYWLRNKSDIPRSAIVATDADQLSLATISLLQFGTRKILIEKPAGLNLEQISKVTQVAKKNKSKVFVAYNRRFYSSVAKAKQIIKSDGGVKSFHFEFTELSYKIAELKKSKEIKSAWFLVNSTHVIDLAFFLGGEPAELYSATSGRLSWHPKAATFVGSGRTKSGALFSYFADWQSPGRWSLEIMTGKHRLIFQPLEELRIQEHGSFEIKRVRLKDHLDKIFKPGLYRQVDAFLNREHDPNLLSIDKHRDITENIYMKILNSSL